MCLTINKCMGLSNFCYINNKRKVQIVYTKHSLLITNLHQQQAYTYFYFRIGIFAHLSSSIFLLPHFSIQKLLIYEESS